MSHHMGVVPARSHIFFGYVPETAKTASRGGGGKGVGTAVRAATSKGLWPALSTMRAAEKASQQRIPVHSARKSHP
eukprot:COSAG01_NODE_38474_length_489_cov_0.746154_1_plen_76_part_00